jgi:hypothetical protein
MEMKNIIMYAVCGLIGFLTSLLDFGYIKKDGGFNFAGTLLNTALVIITVVLFRIAE